ncbi:MAG: hypothetical protein Q8S54_03185 [Bacteroidota bacterium]|nr:hypothetical protein [Odoribacter sp.]MDP3642176.1 hypothetical protein [Bacteroidota bacterium]
MKKTIYLILLAFLIILGSSKVDNVSAQGKSDPKKVTTAHTGSFYAVFDLWCGDKVIDLLSGTMNFHCTMQFENDVMLFMNMQYYGSLTGKTGEVFKYKEIAKFDASNVKYYKGHINAIGDKGSHIVISFTALSEEPWFVINNAKCE